MTEQESHYLKGLKNGDRMVFEQLFREYYPQLCNYARRYIADRYAAEDIVQDFFCKLWDKRGELLISTSFSSYLYKSVSNLCMNHFRDAETERRVIEFPGDEIHDIGGAESQGLDSRELNEYFGRALMELPEKRREIFELSRFEGLKYHEIAEKLDISIKTVETQMTRSLEFLRKYLKDFLAFMLLIINLIK